MGNKMGRKAAAGILAALLGALGLIASIPTDASAISCQRWGSIIQCDMRW
ncbi:MAG: hypothetical protein LBR21_04600 [Propionibacteriaceae bacterium]|nr:hypothetical protein [Propionibacteriaceae bacterium]